MRPSRALFYLVASSLLAGAAACRPPAAAATPSGEQQVFAEVYPARLGQVRADFDAAEQRARGSLTSLASPPAGLRDPERPIARGLFERADRAGRSGYYADEAVRQEGLDGLFDEGRKGLRQRVAGSVSYAVKQKKCGELDCSEELANELGGVAAYAAERSLDRQQEQRLDTHSEAAHYLDAHAAELSARSLEALAKQSRALARTSFTAHVRLELYRRELEQLVEEQESASATLEHAEAEDRAALQQSTLNKAQKAALERRVTELGAQRAQLKQEQPLAEQALEQMPERIEALQQEYQDALSKLLAALEQPVPAAAPATAPAAGAELAAPAAPNADPAR
ncbi:MAG: hypothetical protein RL033_326 [Pseudomonadota bacterium]|jgi:hypothetical protein